MEGSADDACCFRIEDCEGILPAELVDSNQSREPCGVIMLTGGRVIVVTNPELITAEIMREELINIR